MLGSIVYGITLIFSQPRLAAFRDIWHIVCILCPTDISNLWSSTNLHKADAVTCWLCEIVMLLLTSYWLSYVFYSLGRASGDLNGRYKICLWCSDLWRRIPIGGTGHTSILGMFSWGDHSQELLWANSLLLAFEFYATRDETMSETTVHCKTFAMTKIGRSNQVWLEFVGGGPCDGSDVFGSCWNHSWRHSDIANSSRRSTSQKFEYGLARLRTSIVKVVHFFQIFSMISHLYYLENVIDQLDRTGVALQGLGLWLSRLSLYFFLLLMLHGLNLWDGIITPELSC